MFEMRVISAAMLSTLICTGVSAHLKVKKIHKRAFFGEDIYIDIPSGKVSEVVFKPSTNQSTEVVILRAGQVVNSRGSINSLGYLVLEDVQENDEGEYIVKNTSNPIAAECVILLVRDCALEEVVKYGETYTIPLNQIEGPITLIFRPGLVQTNQTLIHHITRAPPVVIYNQTMVVPAEYAGRLIVTEKRVMLHSVRMSNEGSYMVLDHDGKVKKRNCLKVREHQIFLHLTYRENLKMKLYVDHSNVTIVYRPKSDNVDRVIVHQGVVLAPLDPLLEGRLIVEGSELILKTVQVADVGVFKVTDLAGFPVAHVYIEVEAYKLPPLTVAIFSMLGLIASMLLVCLLSCLYKVHKRNEKNKKLKLLAQQAAKGDGDAFREETEMEPLLGKPQIVPIAIPWNPSGVCATPLTKLLTTKPLSASSPTP
ncbi:uncharacterized protein isoform X3 [Takifugu rubripes]|uniref:uncharacterized protein isoform X3 n=2 Tax=Takifugu TaxID=31032 RepID=UPI0011454A90|nr:uncharacterized protein LOC105418854 isoform X3 [Takifugu rubripes]